MCSLAANKLPRRAQAFAAGDFKVRHGDRATPIPSKTRRGVTFSSFSAETMHLFRDNEIKMGLLNILANNIFGLLLVFGGFYIGKQIVSLIN